MVVLKTEYENLFRIVFAMDKPPRRKIYKEPRNKLFMKVNKSVLSHETFYKEDDDHKPVDFINEIVSFTC